MSILIKHGYLVTMEDDRIYRDGAVVVEDNRIVAVDDTGEIIGKYRCEHIIDAHGKLVIPGFVNAHNHSDGDQLSRGYGVDTLVALEYFKQFKWPRLLSMREEDYYIGSLLCYVEMVRTGTTLMADNYYAPKGVSTEGVPKAAEEVGIRSILVRGFHDYQLFMPKEFIEGGEELVTEYERLYRTWHNKANNRIKVWVGPVNLIYNTPESIIRLYELARHHNSGLHSHVAEDLKGMEIVRRRFGKGYIDVFAELGVLDSKFQAAHCIHLSDREIELMKEHGATVVHAPAAGIIFGKGIAPVTKMRKLGVRVALGSDTTMDMVAAMKFAACLQKFQTMDPTSLTAYETLKMATIEGARAFGLGDELGSIAVGKKADITIVDLHKPYCWPIKDPIISLVYFLNGGDVDTVIIDGKIVVKEGKVISVDEDKVLDTAQKAFDSLTARMETQRR